ncbi:MAG: SDR family oxidoreductase [Saonia sp.]
MNIILTGATGTLGSRILFSLLENKFERIEKVYLPVRKKTATTPGTRIKNMLTSEFAPEFIKKNSTGIFQKIQVVDAEYLLEPQVFLQTGQVDYFIHSAGFVNLSTDPSSKDEIFEENLEFTKKIFNVFAGYMKKFVYISTAFSVGNIGGVLDNDYTDKHWGNHRNYYEASKHASEKFLLAEGKKRKLPVQILRPSVLGGNIDEAPNFFISKYMVFYLFAKFFYNNDSKDAIRITTNIDTGLNIIPTDYAAKVIVKVLETDVKQLNIVHSQETNIIKGIAKILEVVGYTNFSFTQDRVNDTTGFISKLEQFYYESIGIHLNPYLTSKPNKWDTTLLESILPIPAYNLEEYLVQTVTFAKTKNFRNQKW